MKLLIIRHADPDYSIDSLTEKGWREAALLSERVASLTIEKVYVSPLGRAKDTASLSLKKLNKEAETLEWLREFHAPIREEQTGNMRIPWDWVPEEWSRNELFYDKDLWSTVPIMQEGKVGEEATYVNQGLDMILNRHGYQRKGNLYHVMKPNNDTIVFFCHFGVECVMLGHLLGISPMVLWHGTCAAPSSVTTLVTEERREGTASFRMTSFADISHLYKREAPSFAARFCECYQNKEERHD